MLALALAGCAHRGGGSPRAAAGRPGELSVCFTMQSLFRVEVETPEAAGRMRWVLRDDPEGPGGAFHLAASDVLGRPLWNLAASGERLALVDHRNRAFCGSTEPMTLPEPALAGLPPSVLPRVLRGQLPFEPGGALGDGEIDFRDGRQRRWSAALKGGEPVSWTLWEGGEPLLWWLRQDRGGVLSHRGGSQFRWRLSVAEPRLGEFVLEAPPDYHHADCAFWDLPQLREDQPPSAGDRPPL